MQPIGPIQAIQKPWIRRVGIYAHGYWVFGYFGLRTQMVGNKCPPYLAEPINSDVGF